MHIYNVHTDIYTLRWAFCQSLYLKVYKLFIVNSVTAHVSKFILAFLSPRSKHVTVDVVSGHFGIHHPTLNGTQSLNSTIMFVEFLCVIKNSIKKTATHSLDLFNE